MVRVVKQNGTVASSNITGGFQVSGHVIFTKNLSKAMATAEAFTSNGWFITDEMGQY